MHQKKIGYDLGPRVIENDSDGGSPLDRFERDACLVNEQRREGRSRLRSRSLLELTVRLVIEVAP